MWRADVNIRIHEVIVERRLLKTLSLPVIVDDSDFFNKLFDKSFLSTSKCGLYLVLISSLYSSPILILCSLLLFWITGCLLFQKRTHYNNISQKEWWQKEKKYTVDR
jgi:hypothetical protein